MEKSFVGPTRNQQSTSNEKVSTVIGRMQRFPLYGLTKICLVFLSLFLMRSDRIYAEGSVVENSYQNLLLKLRQSRLHLKSGKFHVDVATIETLSVNGTGDGTEVDRESWQADVVFDAQVDKSMMQYRLTGDMYHAIKPSPENLLFVTMFDRGRFKFIDPLSRRPRNANGFVQTYANYDCASTTPRPLMAPLNPRCVGFVSLRDLARGDALDTVLLKMRVHNRADAADSAIRLEIDENQIELTQRYQSDRVRMRTVFDCRRNLVPVSKTVEIGSLDDETGKFAVALVRHESIFEWERKNQEYVPSSFTATTYRPEQSKRPDAAPDAFDVRETKSTVNFIWDEVNEPISSGLFKMDTFDAKDSK